jgi:exodeoxyribonuclease-3
MDRLINEMVSWKKNKVPVVVGGDFNVIPEDIDCHKPSSWIRDALFQPEPRARYRGMLELGYADAFRTLHPGEGGHFTFWDYFIWAEAHRFVREIFPAPKLTSSLLKARRLGWAQ